MKSQKLEKMVVDEIAVILGQMVAYFNGRANVEDTDVLTFSLHHLFCRVDYLYRTALPELMSVTPSAPSASSTVAAQTLLEELLRHQHIWTKLRAIRHTLNRMEPLCTLLSDATECILDALDMTSETLHSSHDIPDDATVPWPVKSARDSEQDWVQSLNQERWEQALTAVTESLGQWQQSYNQLALIINHFALVASTFPSLIQLDEVFNILLDSAAAIFGDILPGFQAISVGDDDAVATLLFDLMHQADQLLLQFDAALEPLQALTEYFALKTNR
ncbi:MAG TPA: hypothetical protein VK140_15795 [Ktedonobacteraceae bacterium]|nr:hypothetical protein [Ktedonobacteraceae bacterium]